MKLTKFTVKDVIFIAILSAVLTVAGFLTMPLVMSVTLFGVRNMFSALIYALFAMLGVMKIKKIGTLTLMGLFHGSVLLMMSPIMFWNMFVGALVSELVVFFIYRSYEAVRAQVLGATLFIPLTLPTTLSFTMMIHGKTWQEIMEKPFLSVFICAATVLLSYAGAKLGYKLGKELQKAGKL